MQVEGIPTDESIRELESGVTIQGYRTLPAKARLLDKEPEIAPRNPPIRFRKNIPTSWLELRLREGKNRQVRRMTAAVGFPTLRLVRVAIGNLRLEGLSERTWRELSAREVAELRETAM